MKGSLKLVIGIATAGRVHIVAETLRVLALQTRLPDMVLVCPASVNDFDSAQAADLPFPLECVQGGRGLCAQRNAILEALRGFDVVIFFDDDFFASATFLAEAEYCFAAQPDIVAASGRVIADGTTGPGIGVLEAQAILSSHKPNNAVECKEQYAAYGCNMAFRLAPIHASNLRFDEKLPLYGWLEDIDFCRRIVDHGRIIKNERMVGVHLGHRGGKCRGVQLGYSQIANPIYLFRKGTCRIDIALDQMGRNFAANLAKSLWPEPWVDRFGRLKGNLLALRDFTCGQLDPRRIINLN